MTEIQQHQQQFAERTTRKNNFGCDIWLFSKRRELIRIVRYNDFDGMLRPYSAEYLALFDTPNEYRLLFRYLPLHNVSYFEARHKDFGFIARHYVRNGKIAPVAGYEANIAHDTEAKQKLISDTPRLDWRRIIHDSMFSREKRITDFRYYLKKP